jgi:hypothetical protein
MGAISASMAVAASYQEAVIAQLRAQGYKKIVVETTLLGRVKISAAFKGGRREIILNPRTGEVLRDLWISPDGDVGSTQIARSSTNGDNSDDDNSDDSDDDDSDGDDKDKGGGDDDTDDDEGDDD